MNDVKYGIVHLPDYNLNTACRIFHLAEREKQKSIIKWVKMCPV